MIAKRAHRICPSVPRGFKVLFLACIWSLTSLGAFAECPKVCDCYWRDGKEIASCPGAHFIDIPRGLDPSTQILDLPDNNLKILPLDAFVYPGLTNLQKVWLIDCKLEIVEEGAFRKLANVVDLDLSDNFLTSIPTHAMIDMGGLREFKMSNNSLTYISASTFKHTPELVRLDISVNNITAIEAGALRELVNLEVLDISQNKIQTLDANELIPLNVLRVLKIDGNPWNCDCHLKPLRKWVDDYGLKPSLPPSCSQPRWLEGKAWTLLNLDEFVCAPQVSALAPRVLASEGENVTLVCQVKSEVETTITWLVGDSPIQYTNESERYYISEIVAPDYNYYLSNLTMTGVISQDQGTYRCIAENRAGYREVNVTLQVSHEVAEVRIANVEPTTSFVKNGLVMGISGIISISLLLCSLLYCKLRGGQLDQQKKLKVDIPQASGSVDNEVHKLVGYHMVPTNELEDTLPNKSLARQQSWKGRGPLDEKGVIAECVIGGGGNLHSFDKNTGQLMKVRLSSNVPTTATSTVSYVEIPKSGVGAVRTTLENKAQWKDILVHSRDIRPSAACAQSPSQIPNGNSSQFPDLLDLPQPQGQSMQQQGISATSNMTNISYCTMPRVRSKSCTDTSNIASGADGVMESVANSSFNQPYDSDYRSSSALNLALSEAASQAYAQGQIPIGNHSLIPRDVTGNGPQNPQTLQDLLSSQRIIYNSNKSGNANPVPGQDPYRFEYHATQLEKFLQEYRSLQQQLQIMKQSYQARHRTGSAPRLDCCGDNHFRPPNSTQPGASGYKAHQPYTTIIQTSSSASQPYCTTARQQAPPSTGTISSPPPYLSPSQSGICYPPASKSYISDSIPPPLETRPCMAAAQCYVPAPEAFSSALQPCTNYMHTCQANSPSYTSPSMQCPAVPVQCHKTSPQSYTVPLQMCPTQGGKDCKLDVNAVRSEENGSYKESCSSPNCSEASSSPLTVTFPPDEELSKPKPVNKTAHPKEPLKSILKKTNSFDANVIQQHQQPKLPTKNQWKS